MTYFVFSEMDQVRNQKNSDQHSTKSRFSQGNSTRSGTTDGAGAPFVYDNEQTVAHSEKFVTDDGVHINRIK